MIDLKEVAIQRYRALGLPDDFMNLIPDEDAARFVESLSEEKRRKMAIGLALIQLQIPDEVRLELLTNHLDETERLINIAYQDLSASLVNKLSQAGDAETKSTLGSVRLAMLMNILGFDDATLSGVLTDPILARRASLVAVTCMNEMGQKIQQLYDEKSNEPT